MASSAWLVGSVYLDAFNIEVNTMNKAIPAGNYYLRHPTLQLSLIDTLEAAVQTEAAGAAWYITEGRTSLLQPLAAQNVAIDWLSSTNVRDLLGYTGNMASQDTAYESPDPSPLLWSPGYEASPETPNGTAGYVANDQSRMISADGTRAEATTFSTQIRQRLAWTHILAERMRVDDGTDGGGTFHEFHEQSAKLLQGFWYHEVQNEEAGSVTEVTWDDTVTNRFGPYVLPTRKERAYNRVVRNVDLYCSLTLPIHQITEYT